jgi:hypothetical protein
VSHRPIAVAAALAFAAASLVLAAAPASEASGCPGDAGFSACVHVHYETAPDGTPRDLRLTATLVRRQERCSGNLARRRVVVALDGERVGAARRPGSCRDGVARWHAVFSPGETADWGVEPGSRLRTRWSGTAATATVRIRRRATEQGRLQPPS